LKERKTYAEENMRMIREFKKNEEEKKLGNHIRNGYATVSFQKIEFEEKEVIPGRIWMCIPSDFGIMDEALAEVKYPGANKPDYIYTNDDSTLNICFSIESDLVDNEETERVKDALVKEMKRLYPASPTQENATITIEATGKNVSYFSFTTPVLDGELYNFMFFMEDNHNLLIGTFNCVGFQKKEWDPILPQMLETLRGKENERDR
jgi:hypothetical protein